MNVITGRDRSLVAVLYPVCFLLFALPLVEIALTVWPPRPGGVMWRFGTYGLLSQALMLPTLGVLCALLVARVLGHLNLLLGLAIAVGLGAAAFAAGLVMFVLDGLQARAVAVEQLQPMVAATAVRGFVAMSLYTAVWIWMTAAAVRVWRGRARRRAPATQPRSTLVSAAVRSPH